MLSSVISNIFNLKILRKNLKHAKRFFFVLISNSDPIQQERTKLFLHGVFQISVHKWVKNVAKQEKNILVVEK